MDNKYIDSDGNILYINRDLNITKYFLTNPAITNILHRLDGPAIECMNGTYKWFNNGNLHRIGGPATCYPFLNIYNWYVFGKQVNIYYICG